MMLHPFIGHSSERLAGLGHHAESHHLPVTVTAGGVSWQPRFRDESRHKQGSGAPSRSIHPGRLVNIAIQPALAGFGGSDDGMAGDLCVAGGVSVRRTVATMRLAAFLAGSKVHPGVAGFHALHAFALFGKFQVPDVEMFAALCHCILLAPLRQQRLHSFMSFSHRVRVARSSAARSHSPQFAARS